MADAGQDLSRRQRPIEKGLDQPPGPASRFRPRGQRLASRSLMLPSAPAEARVRPSGL
jgi:hypothetical protein